MDELIRPQYVNRSLDPFGPEGVIYLTVESFADFIKKPDNRALSKAHIVRGVPWRILALTRGGSTRGQGGIRNPPTINLGVFLQCNTEETEQKSLWRCYGQATLEVISQLESGTNLSKRITHTFNNTESDWGFTSFEPLENLLNPENGYCLDGSLKLRCYFTADVPNGNLFSWDSKKNSGCIGLRNQGATCYMNSILQAFYFTTAFRNAVFEMQVSDDPPDRNVGQAMQRVFYELQISTEPVETRSLTQAFGWDNMELFNQHDVQEFCRVLLDNLETKMKGTPSQDKIPSLFRGRMKSFIRCIDIDYESSRVEDFYDVQLNVLGMGTLEKAFEGYTSIEVLDGDNKYAAEGHGLQRAEKGVKFVQLPPVLHIQLLRFQYLGVEQKINEKFTFPLEINLKECCVELSDEDCVYKLHSVLVHSGEFHGGHYVTFIQTNLYETTVNKDTPPKWCKFDDDIVSRTTLTDAINANFGGEKSNTSAYMLIYARAKDIPTILEPLLDENIPPQVVKTFETERALRYKKKKQIEDENHCAETILVTPECILNYHGLDFCDSAKLEDNCPHELVPRTLTPSDLYDIIQRKLFYSGVPEEDEDIVDYNFRIWKIDPSKYDDGNEDSVSTQRFRPSYMIDRNEDTTLEKMFQKDVEFVFIETSYLPAYPLMAYDEDRDLMVFLKYYDTHNNVISTVGHMLMNKAKSLQDYIINLVDICKLPKNAPFGFYEEVASDHVRKLNPTESLGTSLVEDRVAIVVLENALLTTEKNNAKLKLEDMYDSVDVEVMENLLNKTRKPIPSVNIEIKLSWSLEKLTEVVGHELNIKKECVMLWKVIPISGKNQPFLGDYSLHHVEDLFGPLPQRNQDPRKIKKAWRNNFHNSHRYRLFYTSLPFPFREYNKRHQMKLKVMDAKMNIEDRFVWPEKSGTVANILKEASAFFPFEENGTRKLRLVQVGVQSVYGRAFGIWNEKATVEEVDSKMMNAARVEEIPEDQLEVNSNEYLMAVSHFDKEPTKLFGVPFYLKIKHEELLSSIKNRIREKLNVSETEISKFKFALISRETIIRYLDVDGDGKVNLMELGSHLTTGPSFYLGLDHKSPVLHPMENSIRILN